MQTIENIIFDLGGVLVDWNPEYLYQKIFSDEKEMNYFLSNICTSDWNEQQDEGRRLLEATDMLVKEHPEYELPIRAFYGRWDEMLGGPIKDTVAILRQLIEEEKVNIFALTNWSAETYPIAYYQYEFLHWFEDVIVSGKEKIRKPFPEIYQLAATRFGVTPDRTIFIDDNLRNVKAAEKEGFHAIHFTAPKDLRKILKKQNLLS